MSTTQHDTKQKTIFIVLIVVLIGIIGFLIINQSRQSKTIAAQEEQLDDAERLQLDLERQYYESLSELEQQRSNNEQLNALIEAQKEELRQQKGQIEQLIRTKSDLNAARQQIAQLKTQTATYLEEIEDLRKKNEMLLEENKDLQRSNVELYESVQRERSEKQELATEKSSLLSERERLSMTNKELSQKVTKASMVAVDKIDVQGLQIRSSGKERKKARANSVDRLRICFDALENAVAEAGYERFYIRIINPQGETLSVESLGSGTFSGSDSGEKLKYTQIKELEYAGAKTQACLNWDQDGEFAAGEYVIEIYNKGYLAGKSTFRLK